jgi:hypothetical protein
MIPAHAPATSAIRNGIKLFRKNRLFHSALLLKGLNYLAGQL